MENENWLAIAVGNSRLHWAWFQLHHLTAAWDTEHLTTAVEPDRLPQPFLHINLVERDLTCLPVYLASVVRKQTQYWRSYRYLTLVSLADIKLTNTYPSLGIDRALAISAAVATHQQACLVIDGGTALTFTGANQQGKLIGGAILPGLRSQLFSLQQKTSALPEIILPERLPERWAADTDTAIASGILYTAIAGIYGYITDWLGQFPQGQIIFTGGDGELLAKFVLQQFPQFAEQTAVNSKLVFEGIRLIFRS